MISPLFRMSGDEARGLLFGLMESNKVQLRKYPDMPSMRELIRDKKVVYDAYDPQEHWKTYKELVDEARQNGTAYADCEDLAVAVAAEDQVRYGVQSLPFAYSPREGLFHVVTAVPSRSVVRGPRGGAHAVVSGVGEPARVPFGFESWPVAMGAHHIDGYVLQDPSRAAGMGSFGYAPDVGVSASRYGGLMYGAEGKRKSGLGSAVRAFREGLLGGDTGGKILSELGSGVRTGSGLGEGWAGRLGERLPEAIGVKGKKIQPKEDSAVKSLRKGMDQEEKEAPSRDEGDEDDEDFEDDDEEFGLDDIVASEMFGENPYYLDDGSRSEYQSFGEDDDEDEEDEDLDLDLSLDDDDEDDDDDDDDGDDDEDVDLDQADALPRKDQRRWISQARKAQHLQKKAGKKTYRASVLTRKMNDLLSKKKDESFAGLSNLRRTDLFGGNFKFSSSEEDLLIDED